MTSLTNLVKSRQVPGSTHVSSSAGSMALRATFGSCAQPDEESQWFKCANYVDCRSQHLDSNRWCCHGEDCQRWLNRYVSDHGLEFKLTLLQPGEPRLGCQVDRGIVPAFEARKQVLQVSYLSISLYIAHTVKRRHYRLTWIDIGEFCFVLWTQA